jgi:hypothetical protein
MRWNRFRSDVPDAARRKVASKADALEIYRQGFGAIAPRLRPDDSAPFEKFRD